jgi:hypothetical protein
LEVALHPHTNDEEVIAAVNGFRRTADGTPLSRLCREFAGLPAAGAAETKDGFDRLTQENLELRHKVEAAEASRAAMLRRLQEAERRARDLGEELLAAEHRAGTAEQRLSEFQGAYGRISGGLHSENFDLRRALAEAARTAPAPPRQAAAQPFHNMLSAARQRLEPAQPASPPPGAGRPWTA